MRSETNDDKIRHMVELARGHMDAGGVNAAGVYYRMIIKDTAPPKTALERIARGEACMWYARKALAERLVGTACDWFRKALDADPRATEYRDEYCRKALIPMGLHKAARIEAERATKIDPTNSNAWRTLGGMEHALCNTAAAIAAYDKAVELAPDDPIARLDRATVALDTSDHATVRRMVLPVLDTKYRGDAMHCLAMVAYREGRHDDAIGLYDEAIADNCYDPKLAEWNKALAMHSIGRYAEGWQAHEARGQQRTDEAMALMMNRFTRPIWAGEPPPARLHLHQEMGFGDVIAMLRYVPDLIESGYEISIEVNDSLVALTQRSFPKAKVVPKAADYPGAVGLPPFDYHIPMLSLPAILKTDIDTVPWQGAYLAPDPELVKKYASALGKRHCPRVGIVWTSGVRMDGIGPWLVEYGRRKSMRFDQVRPLIDANHPLCEFFSLQVGPGREQNDLIVDLLPVIPSWDDTAALIQNLDLVISVDTSVAHLAGALGKPLWVMMHKEGSWHWMVDRLDSPWYPSARLFRQTNVHKWDDVVAQVSNALKAYSITPRKEHAA